jgi:uncharacterized protein
MPMTVRRFFVVLLCGALLGFGLALSTMILPEVVLSFLQGQDFGLMLVLGGAAGITALAYRFAPRVSKRPLMAAAYGTHPSVYNRETAMGSALFGIGWGLCGVCPGPAIAGLGAGNWPLLIAVAGIASGAYLQGVTNSNHRQAAPANA